PSDFQSKVAWMDLYGHPFCGGINKEVIEDMALRDGNSHILLLKCRQYLLFNCTVMQDIIFLKNRKAFISNGISLHIGDEYKNSIGFWEGEELRYERLRTRKTKA
ncbi:hypothetical protein C5S39_08380, partial [Candidatus Methanophagaceae archaeon]